MNNLFKPALAINQTVALLLQHVEPASARESETHEETVAWEHPEETLEDGENATFSGENSGMEKTDRASLAADSTNSLSPLALAPVSELSDATIVDELPSLREVNVKHFYKTDGSRAAYIYTIPVHEQLSDGSWTDIDNTLYESKNEAGETVYSRKGLSFHIDFSAELSDGLVYSFTGADGSFSLSLENLPKGESVKASYTHAEKDPGYEKLFTPAIGGVLTYKDIFPGVDLSYQLVGNSVKENLILQNISSGRDPNRKTK